MGCIDYSLESSFEAQAARSCASAHRSCQPYFCASDECSCLINLRRGTEPPNTNSLSHALKPLKKLQKLVVRRGPVVVVSWIRWSIHALQHPTASNLEGVGLRRRPSIVGTQLCASVLREQNVSGGSSICPLVELPSICLMFDEASRI